MGKRRKRKIEKLADYYLAPARDVLAAAFEADVVAMIGRPLAPKEKTKLKSRFAMLDARS